MSHPKREPGPRRPPSPIRHVGVCVDRSPVGNRVIGHAVALARAFGAEVTALHALEPPREHPDATPTDPLNWEVQRIEARRHLVYLGCDPAAADLPVRAEVLEGRPAEEVRDWVRSHDVDLTVLCSHGESGWTEWSLASTARKLIEGIPGSLLLVPVSSCDVALKGEVAYDRILVLLDGSRRAESALPVAVTVARPHFSELLLLHVVPRPESSCPCPHDAEEHDLDQRVVDRNARAAKVYLEGMRERETVAGQGVRVRTLVCVDGDVRDEILHRIAEEHVDLVVLSGHGHVGRADSPFGSVTSFLLEHATTPLLVVRERTAHGRTGPKGRTRRGGRLPQLGTS